MAENQVQKPPAEKVIALSAGLREAGWYLLWDKCHQLILICGCRIVSITRQVVPAFPHYAHMTTVAVVAGAMVTIG